MGCYLPISKEAAKITGVKLLEQMSAGSKLEGSMAQQERYFEEYTAIIWKLNSMPIDEAKAEIERMHYNKSLEQTRGSEQ